MGRQGNEQRSGKHRLLDGGVDQVAVEAGEQVEDRHPFQTVALDKAHVVGGDLLRRQHAVEAAVLIRNRKRWNARAFRRDGLPGMVDADRGGEDGRRVVIQIRNLRLDRMQQGRWRKVEFLEQQFSLVAQLSNAGGRVGAFAQRILQDGVGKRGDNGIGVGISVSGDVDWFHSSSKVCITKWALPG
ncbi:hypothetical protein SDC9_153356 [bioreactor metagenome]|uniref:Uncharacterized protein n=1 Tax=bioreactor metagenome TaxID=1076179 RepID=A0A645EVP4_9ZZZZ